MGPASRRTTLFSDTIQPGKTPGCKSAANYRIFSLVCLRNGQFLKKPLSHPAGQAVSGGDDGTRTRDFRLAKAALSQLSYIPEKLKNQDYDVNQWA